MKVIIWVLSNGALLVLLWFGLVMDMAGPRNVGLFIVWFATAIALFMCSKDIRKKLAAKKDWPAVPGWVDGTFDLVVVGFLVWFGRWWAGSAYALHAMIGMALREEVKKIRLGEKQEKRDE